jgi:hypothetical protein
MRAHCIIPTPLYFPCTNTGGNFWFQTVSENSGLQRGALISPEISEDTLGVRENILRGV